MPATTLPRLPAHRKGSPMLPSNDSAARSICSVPDCGRPVSRRGWCATHYDRWRKHGSPGIDPIEPRVPRGCPDEDRLWPNVDRSGGPDACWPWTGRCNEAGYGVLKRRGHIDVLAHRLAWKLTNGPIPPGMLVCHKCDNPPCCNPYKCLFLGTDADNRADCVEKDRHHSPRGERQGSSKLTDAKVAAMRERHAAGDISYSEIAREYGVSNVAARLAILRITWPHVP